jgi:hypothetical protein
MVRARGVQPLGRVRERQEAMPPIKTTELRHLVAAKGVKVFTASEIEPGRYRLVVQFAHRNHVLTGARGAPREWASLDSVAAYMRRLGATEVTVAMLWPQQPSARA